MPRRRPQCRQPCGQWEGTGWRMPTSSPAATRSPLATVGLTGWYVMRKGGLPEPVRSMASTPRPATWPAKATCPAAAARTGEPGPAIRSTPRWPGPYAVRGGSKLRARVGRAPGVPPSNGQARPPAGPIRSPGRSQPAGCPPGLAEAAGPPAPPLGSAPTPVRGGAAVAVVAVVATVAVMAAVAAAVVVVAVAVAVSSAIARAAASSRRRSDRRSARSRPARPAPSRPATPAPSRPASPAPTRPTTPLSPRSAEHEGCR